MDLLTDIIMPKLQMKQQLCSPVILFPALFLSLPTIIYHASTLPLFPSLSFMLPSIELPMLSAGHVWY